MLQSGFVWIILHLQGVFETCEMIKNIVCPLFVRMDILSQVLSQLLGFRADIRKLKKPTWEQ